MNLYLVRHGQTDWNIGKQVQGVADIELNSTGLAQAAALRDHISAQNLHFDHVYASPLRRASKTAQVITDNRPDIIYDDRLVERSFGDLEGKIVDWNNLGVDYLDIRQNTNIHDIEPIQTVLARSKSFLDDLLARHASEPDANILIVAHGALLKTLHYNLLGYDEDTDLHGFRFGNCELCTYSLDGPTARLISRFAPSSPDPAKPA